MRLRPSSLIADLVSPAPGDRARAGARRTTDIPKFFTKLLEVSTRTVVEWRHLFRPECTTKFWTKVWDRWPVRRLSDADFDYLSNKRRVPKSRPQELTECSTSPTGKWSGLFPPRASLFSVLSS